jgi:hypothetical protein
MEDSVDELLPSYNLTNDKVRKVYFALSNDPINQQFFWSEYKVVVSLRNKAIHAGSRIQESQAQMVVRVAKLVVRHLQSIEQRAFKSPLSNAESIATSTSA